MREFELDCIIGFLVVLIISLFIGTIISARQLSLCANNESPYCPLYTCDTANNDGSLLAVRRGDICRGTKFSVVQQ